MTGATESVDLVKYVATAVYRREVPDVLVNDFLKGVARDVWQFDLDSHTLVESH